MSWATFVVLACVGGALLLLGAACIICPGWWRPMPPFDQPTDPGDWPA